MALVAICALGAGITGTMLWAQNRPAPIAAPSATGAPSSSGPLSLPSVSVPNSGTAMQSGSHEPPTELTSGMSPSEAALTLGNWHYDHEQWNEATRNYRAAIAGGVDNPNVRTDLGNALRFSDQPKEALQQYQRAQKQDPTHEQSLFNQGALYAVSLKSPRKGIESWQAYLKRFPNGASAKQARELIAKFAGGQQK